MFDKDLKVGIGDMKFTRNEGRVVTYALGSCVGVTFYDPMIHLGALLHVMLPNKGAGGDMNPFKYADAGIHETLRKLTAFGMMKSRTVVKIAGGAKMFEISGKADFGGIYIGGGMMMVSTDEDRPVSVTDITTGYYQKIFQFGIKTF